MSSRNADMNLLDAKRAFMDGEIDRARAWADQAADNGDPDGRAMRGLIDVVEGRQQQGQDEIEQATREGSVFGAGLAATQRSQRGDLSGAFDILAGVRVERRDAEVWSLLSWNALQLGRGVEYLRDMTSERLAVVLGEPELDPVDRANVLNNHVSCMVVSGVDRPADEALWQELVVDGELEALMVAMSRASLDDDRAEVSRLLSRVQPEVAEKFWTKILD